MAFLAVAVWSIREASQNRPDVDDGAAPPTSVELELLQRYPSRPAEEVATALWVACRGRLPHDIGLSRTIIDDSGRPTLHLDAAVGAFARRHFVGCLEDATLDRVQATVSFIGAR